MGVSVNTVSRALRDMPDIGGETRAAIKAQAPPNGLFPQFWRHTPCAPHRSMAIGVVVSDIANPIFSDMLKGIDSAANEAGYSLLLANTNENDAQEMTALENMLLRDVDGILLFPTMQQQGAVELLQKNKVPFVLAGRRFPRINTKHRHQ